MNFFTLLKVKAKHADHLISLLSIDFPIFWLLYKKDCWFSQ